MSLTSHEKLSAAQTYNASEIIYICVIGSFKKHVFVTKYELIHEKFLKIPLKETSSLDIYINFRQKINEAPQNLQRCTVLEYLELLFTIQMSP